LKVSTIYDQGSAPHREDGLIVVGSRVFGVLDGTSAPYAPKSPPRMFDGMSGGEMVARTCERFAHIHTTSPDLRNLVLDINKVVGKVQRDAGVLDDAGELAGAVLAFAWVDDKSVNIVQAGNCLAIVELKGDTILVTPNQAKRHEEEMRAQIKRLQREVARELFGLTLEKVPEEHRDTVRSEMWNRFYQPLRNARRRDANNPASPQGYGILNGQDALVHLLQEWALPLEEVSTLLLVTDGMMPKSVETSSGEEACRTLLAEFKLGGLAGLLLSARAAEKQIAATNYIKQAEATAIALVF